MGLLKRDIRKKGHVKIIEVHDGLSSLIAQNAKIDVNGKILEYDGFWIGSFADSASKGIPDAEIVGFDSRLHTINEILNVTSKPILVDGDTGGSPAQFEYFVRYLERLGVSGVIIEDKVFPKRSSLDESAKQDLEDPEIFAKKLRSGINVKINDDFMIIARIESLITGTGLEDALSRAKAYAEVGVEGIMIHSKKDSPDDVLAFARKYEKLCEEIGRRPFLVCVPTTYNLITDRELAENGFNIIIHANHLIRAAHKSMKNVANTILLSDRNFEAETLCSPVSEIFEDLGFTRIKEQDKKYAKEQRIWVVIPAAGKDPIFKLKPKSLIEIGGKTILEYQLESIRKAGLRNISIVRGYKGELFNSREAKYLDNPEYETKYILHSLLCAREIMDDGFILIFSDILFNESIIKSLLKTKDFITLLVDNSYRYHKHEIDKKLDLVVSKTKKKSHHRALHPTTMNEIIRIGKNIDKDEADGEFIGIAYFSPEGVNILKKVYDDCKKHWKGKFHEAESFDRAAITDILQEIIDRGFTVKALEIYKGWMEIHNPVDIKIAEKEILQDGVIR
ncbi:MAG: isocitrate lyase/phosphoenolpyruvate mutase family protein [Candidatus Lokiarchaeia archaeon]